MFETVCYCCKLSFSGGLQKGNIFWDGRKFDKLLTGRVGDSFVFRRPGTEC